MQRIPADARLGRLYAGQDVGYRLLTLGRAEFVPFTTFSVVETLPGCFAVIGGVDAPDAGGYIVWGLADKDVAESTIEPVAPNLTDDLITAIRFMLDSAIARITAVMPSTPVVQMDTGSFERGVNKLRSDMMALVLAGSTQQAERVSEIQTQLGKLSESYAGLRIAEDVSRQLDALTAMRDRLSEVIGDRPQAITLIRDGDTAHLATVLETVRADIDKLSGDVQNTRQVGERKNKSLQALDKFLQQVGG